MRKVLPVTVIAAMLLFFVAINVFASQWFPQSLFKVVRLDDPQATKQFLAHIEETPDYPVQYHYLNSIFDNTFAYEDIRAEYSLRSEVQKYEDLLKKNDKNPQVLMKIALIHYDRDDRQQAAQFYIKAKAVDPWIRADELEGLK